MSRMNGILCVKWTQANETVQRPRGRFIGENTENIENLKCLL